MAKEEDKDKVVKPTRFGRYLILDHLVDGGMGKICRARFLGEQAEKIVAIKMIRPQYSSDPSFKKMFMDEIKVAFALIHPNITQTYDYGIQNGQLYTSMEYNDGKTLKQVLDRLKEKKVVFPVEICIYIISQICQGLSYAHNFTDKLSGKKQNIIHRDISPHNVMITFDGGVKIIDFGIAKANTNSEETQAGTIKGKLSYLAPEYLEGMELDHRYDQFAVGITLWELLCSRKMFHAENELAILKKIQACKILAPSSINPNVLKELDAIVLKSLSKQREDRYENMDQFNRALVKFLYSTYPDFNATDLGYFSKELFRDDIKKDQEKLVEFGKIDVTPFLQELKREMEGKGSINSDKDDGNKESKEIKTPEHKSDTTRRIVLDFDDETNNNSTSSNLLLGNKPLANNAAIKKNMLNANQKASALKIKNTNTSDAKTNHHHNNNLSSTSENNSNENVKKTGVSSGASLSKIPSKATAFAKSKNVVPVKTKNNENTTESNEKTNQKEENENAGDKKKQIKMIAVASVFILILIGGTFSYLKNSNKTSDTSIASNDPVNNTKNKNFNNNKNNNKNPKEISRDISSIDGSSSKSTTSISETQKKKVKRITFNNFNSYQKFFVNNQEVEYNISGIELPIKTNIALRVEQEGMKPIFLDFQLAEDDANTMNLPEPKSGILGILELSGDFTAGSTLSFEVDGHTIIYQIPFPGKKIPIGKYEGTITNKNANISKKVPFEIKEDMVTKLY
ncbi:MAG: serine/threonine protein kinase [Oligoflexia bacterium]|nr:serine/threonine protein kinase [Oligoflexia bacterium]